MSDPVVSSKDLSTRAAQGLRLMLIFACAALAVSKPIFSDEGWAMLFAKGYNETGGYANVMIDSLFPMVFLKIEIWINALVARTAGSYDPYWAFRVPSLVLASLAAACISRAFDRLRVRAPARVFLFAVMVFWFQQIYPGMITIRHEMYYFPAVAYAIFALTAAEETVVHFLLGIAVSAIAFADHPNAALGLIPLAVAAPVAMRTFRSRADSRRTVAVCASVAIVAVLVSWWILSFNFDGFDSMREAFRALAGDPNHKKGLRSEPERYRALLSFSVPVAVTLAAGVATALRGVFAEDALIRRISLTVPLTLSAIAFIGAKWPVYFVTVLPALMLVSGHYLGKAAERRAGLSPALLAAGGVLCSSVLLVAVRDAQSNTLLRAVVLKDEDSVRDRRIVNERIRTESVHADPTFFPYVERGRFVPFWRAADNQVTSWHTARFKIDRAGAPDPGIVRHTFSYCGVSYELSERAPSDQGPAGPDSLPP
jgi:hypothetical protein